MNPPTIIAGCLGCSWWDGLYQVSTCGVWCKSCGVLEEWIEPLRGKSRDCRHCRGNRTALEYERPESSIYEPFRFAHCKRCGTLEILEGERWVRKIDLAEVPELIQSRERVAARARDFH